MTLTEKPIWSNAIRPEILVWFKKYIDDIDHIEIRPRYVEFTAKVPDGRKEETHAMALTREDEICKPGSPHDPESRFSIWNYVQIYQGMVHQIIRFTDQGHQTAEQALAYMTELNAWEQDEKDWKAYQTLKRKFEPADQAA